MEDYNFIVGQQFSDVKAFRKAIKDAAIAQHFELKIIKSDLIRYFAKCAKDGCPWRIRAVKLPSVPTFTIRAIEGTHTCGKNAQLGHHQASVDWIVNLIEERLRDNMNYKPKDILQDVQKLYGITIPYKQAWRAKERGLAAIYGSSEEGYCLLPSYCEQIKQRTRTCSCRDWQLYGIPCSHAVAALISSRKNVYEYAEKYFTVESYCRAYSQPIHPVADRSEWSKATEGLSEDDEARLVRPPKFRRPPGRPEKKRGCTEESNREKHTVHCSRCNQTGHYKRTCKAGIVQMIEH
ncbi:uncharacterized protein A4U43_C03F24670 [Asparagus officinalis]|uniref:SWIM-type domain-containing protein n=1 Tax=Asparagus officinalis TaxID=4686 RepID=A0A5P1FHV7_ASPOF|nr:uncharacterized protein A4U43_C03F24670 [Asparagus officinalis]